MGFVERLLRNRQACRSGLPLGLAWLIHRISHIPFPSDWGQAGTNNDELGRRE